MQGKKDYQERLFDIFQLSERIPQNDFYRKLKGAIDLHFLYPLTKGYYGESTVEPRLRHTYPVHAPEEDQYDRARTGEQGDAPIGNRLQPEEVPEIPTRTIEKRGGGTCFGGIGKGTFRLLFGAYIKHRKLAYNF